MTDHPTVESETARVDQAAAAYGIRLADVAFSEDTPELVRPAARLFGAFSDALTAHGLDPSNLLADARHGAVLSSLEDYTTRLAAWLVDLVTPRPDQTGPRQIPGPPTIVGDLVELDALRRLEPTLANLLREIQSAAARARLAVANERDVATALGKINGHGKR